MKRNVLRASVTLAAVGALLAAVPASAHDFGVGGGIYFAANRFHKFFNTASFRGNLRDASFWNNANNLGPTDLVPTHTASHTGSDAANYAADYGDTGWSGRVQCMARVSGSTTRCKHWHVKYNMHYGRYTVTTARSIVCEEAAHTVGLRHTRDRGSCLSRPVNWRNTRLTSHQRGHLNARY